jgi:pimeloyl-ACP methyl ester carboxylesterase
MGVVLSRLPRSQLIEGLRQLFADPSCIEEDWYDAAIDDFRAVWKSPRARMAFFKSLRNIYLDEPLGDEGFWARLERMETPALYVYGKRDTLITHHFSKRVARALPKAKVVVWDDCGHVPQIEHPERTVDLLESHFGVHTPARSSRG